MATPFTEPSAPAIHAANPVVPPTTHHSTPQPAYSISAGAPTTPALLVPYQATQTHHTDQAPIDPALRPSGIPLDVVPDDHDVTLPNTPAAPAEKVIRKHLDASQRQRIRTLHEDARLTKSEIAKVTGYSFNQIKTAIRAPTAEPKQRSGRPHKMRPEEEAELVDRVIGRGDFPGFSQLSREFANGQYGIYTVRSVLRRHGFLGGSTRKGHCPTCTCPKDAKGNVKPLPSAPDVSMADDEGDIEPVS